MSIVTTSPVKSRALTGFPDVEGSRAGAVVVGVSGMRQNAAVAAAIDGRLLSMCEQERVTRVRSVGLVPGAMPTEALTAVLQPLHRSVSDVETFVTAERGLHLPGGLPLIELDHHYAHAATAALTSTAASAVVLVCDRHSNPPVSVWTFESGRLTDAQWGWTGEGLAALYSECAELFGFGPRGEHRLEALARLAPDKSDPDWGIQYGRRALRVCPGWRARIMALRSGSPSLPVTAAAAASFQRAIGDALVDLAHDIRRAFPADDLCLGGGLFYNTYLNTRLSACGAFRRISVPFNPGNAGLAAGAALAVSQGDHLAATGVAPFLGQAFDAAEIKATLDNCKLTYEFLDEHDVISTTVQALHRGALIGWFQGPMESGHRALGSRSILASPFAPHVLENLNAYLKRREHYRAYGVSVCASDVTRFFLEDARSAFMELEFTPRDPASFRILPHGARTLRVQTVADEACLFARLHRAFGACAGAPVLVNTSFNGFHEPIVCTPRDAVRVFFGSGLDMLVIGGFVVRK